MWGIFYNEHFDSLIVTRANSASFRVEKQPDLTLIYNEADEIIGFNLFHVHQSLSLHYGFQSFNPQVIAYIQRQVKDYLDFEQQTQFVVGHVDTCELIPETHLHQTKINVQTKSLDIICGAENIAQNEAVVVALPGSWMPNGMQIQPGKLRGLPSHGMITSAQELTLKKHPFNKKGIIVLPEDYHQAIGQDFFKLYQERK